MTDRFEPPRVRAIARRAVALVGAIALVAACSSPQRSSSAASATLSGTPQTTVEASPVPSSPSPNPSPTTFSAGRIAFVRHDPAFGFSVAWTMAPDGSDQHALAPGHYAALPRWSADGTRLSATNSLQGRFETIFTGAATPFEVLQQDYGSLILRCGAWTPDGQRLACEGWSPTTRGREGIYTVLSSTGGGLTRLTSSTGGIHDIPGDYSPDGTQILFVRATYEPVKLGQVWIANADGTNARKITDTLTGYRVSWSNDGRWIVGDSGDSLLVFDLQNLAVDPFKITVPGGSASQPRWSPDGTRIVFQFHRFGVAGFQIYSIGADGTGAARLTSGNSDGSPDWGTPGF